MNADGPLVGIDAQLMLGTATGIGEYVRGLADALDATGARVVRLCEPRLDPWRFDRRVAWDQAVLPRAAARAKVDVLHCAAGTLPLASPVPVVATVHDVAWLRVQAHARPYARWYFGRFQLARYRRAAAIFVDSFFSRDELLAVAPELGAARVAVLYPGVANDLMAVVRRPAEAPTMLAVGTVEVRKNLGVLVEALPALPGVRLVAIGPPTPYRDVVLARATELGVADRIELRGYVTREALLEAYATATVAAVPSRYEGFGYGVAQALCAGVPLVAAAAASLPEIAAGAAPLVAPDDRAGWIDALRAIVANREAAENAAAIGRVVARERFGWAVGAALARTTYARVADGPIDGT